MEKDRCFRYFSLDDLEFENFQNFIPEDKVEEIVHYISSNIVGVDYDCLKKYLKD